MTRVGMEPGRASPLATAAWTVTGVAGCVGLALTGTRLAAVPAPGPSKMWFSLSPGHESLLRVIFYVSVALVIGGWLGIGVQVRRRGLTPRAAFLMVTLWSIPLLLGPPLFSRDVYSYVGQGVLAHRGFNPYSVGPSVLGGGQLLASIASVWRHTPAPYGPLFVTISRAVVTIFGHSLVAETVAFRALELVGMALMAYSLPRLAKKLGADPGIALWLGLLSPLVLFSFVASGHNDGLMVGLLVTGVTLASEGKLKTALVICALATTIKVPAAAAVVFLAVQHLRGVQGRERLRAVAKVVLIPVATLTAVTLASGLGWTWLGLINLRIPSELRVLSTPTVSVGDSLSHLANLVGLSVAQHDVVTVVQYLAGAVCVVAVVWLLTRVRAGNVVRLLAISLLLVVLLSPTVWPWYLTWGLVLLAATPSQTSKLLALGAALAILVSGPSGTPMLSGYDYVVMTLACLAGIVWLVREKRWSSVLAGRVV
ncbi:MAG: polyprenol phosphomannose-dependent alpha 1,6 mannosyltransferase MptB [Acidimicrobiales bacterium]